MTEEKPRPDPEEVETSQVEGDEPGAEPDAAEDGVEPDPAAELENARAQAEENWNECLRARAELQNFHRRAQRDIEQAHKFAVERFVKDLLPVRDSLEQGLEAAREESGGAGKLIEGKELTLRMLDKVFADHGIEEIDPAGQRFDPESHEAMTMQPSADHEPDTVIMVLQKGYRLNGRLIRPARVIVASAPADDGNG